MNSLENNDSEIAALKNQLFTLLVALIVVTGTFTVYLYRQVSMANKGIQQDKQIEAGLVANEQAIGNFIGRLMTYGAKHPDFAPVLKKYGLVMPPGGMPTGAPPVSPAAPAAPKK